MMPAPRFLENKQIDYHQWDACIAASDQQIIYAFSWYLDVVSPGWGAMVQEEDGNYVAVMPLPVLQKFALSFVQQPFFCQQLGFFSINSNNRSAEDFISLLVHHFSYISNYSFNTSNSFYLGLPADNSLLFTKVFTHHLYLNTTYETLYKNYSADRKLNLKRAQKAGLNIKESNDIEGLIRLFKEDTAFKITGGVREATYQKLRDLVTQIQNRGFARLFYSYTVDGELDAGCLFVINNYKIIYLFNAASKEGRSRNGRTLILDKIIREYAGQKYILDFESPAAEPNISRVYQGFGAKPIPYFILHYNNLPTPVKLIKSVRQQFFQKLLPQLIGKKN